MHYKIITMLVIRTDRDKIIKPRLKTTCTHFYEITCTKVISRQCLYKVCKGFKPKYYNYIYSTRHNPRLLLYIPVTIHVGVDAYYEPLYKWVSQCTSPYGLKDISAVESGFPENFFFFFFFFLNQGNLPKSTLSTLSMQQANLFTTN